MYIDEKLIKILETHRGETIDVSYAISLIKIIAKEHETEQCNIANVVGQSEQLHGVKVLCYFEDICRVGHWDSDVERWVIHSDGLQRYRKFIDKYLPIPK